MTPTPHQLKLLAEIGSGLSVVSGSRIVQIDALIARGLVTGVRLGYFDLRLTPEGRHVLTQNETATGQSSLQLHNRRRGDKR